MYFPLSIGRLVYKDPQPPERSALTGAAGGADLFDIMALLGEESVLRRIEGGIERLSG